MKNLYIIAGSLIILSGLGVITFNKEVFSPERQSRALLTKGRLLLDQNSMETQKEAMEIFTTVASSFPKSNAGKEALYYLAELYEKWGNIDVAINKYRSLLSLNLNKELSDKVKFSIAKLQLSRYNAQEGYNALMVLLSENVDDMLRSDIYTEIARFNARQKNLENAQSNFEIALSENPKNKDADMELANVLFEQKKYDDALKQYEHFFNIHVNRSERNEETAVNFQKKLMESATEVFHDGDTAASQKYFKFISDKFPSTIYSETSLYYLGNLEYIDGKYKQAIETFNKVIKFSPVDRDESAYLKKGQSYYQLHDYAAAARMFSEVQELYPDGKYFKLAKKWENESKMAMSERVNIQTLREENQSNTINDKSNKQDIIDFFEKDLPVESEKVVP
ncbi:MAG: tetratricopeptide repeat protein [Spirochaetia bacterium]|nr:tetratricopeptide repeat protein [Spirochaetia bacterium]